MVKKKKVTKRKAVVKSKLPVIIKKSIFSSVKLGLVFRNLVLFVLLALISWVLYIVLEGVLGDIFNFLWIIFVFISVAFFLALLILLFLKLIRK